MKRCRKIVWAIVVTIPLFCLAGQEATAQLDVVRVGLVLDGPFEGSGTLVETFRKELEALLRTEYDVRLPEQKRLTADWTLSGIEAAIDRLLADDEVDILIAVGILASHAVARRTDLSKPTFATLIVDRELQGIPSQPRERQLPPPTRPEKFRVSGVDNLNYLELGVELVEEIEQFREIAPFSRLTVLLLDSGNETAVESNLARILSSIGLEEIEVVWVGSSLPDLLNELSPSTEAIYMTPLPRFSAAEMKSLAQELIERRIPTFSSEGRLDVERGFLAGLGPGDQELERVRQIALNVRKVLSGEPASELAVDFKREPRLSINATTAQMIGVSPPFLTLIEADVIGDLEAGIGRTISLAAVIREASQVNLDLAAADRTVSAGSGTVREARSGLLPALELKGAATFIDEDRARTFALIPEFGERNYTISATASQLIFSDQAWANFRIQQQLQTVREEERSELRLDVILEAAQSYLGLLQAKTIERIQITNLTLTRSNLNTASNRVETGIASRGEVFRWQSQIATNQTRVVSAEAQRRKAQFAVNRVLNRPLEESFQTVEADLNDPEMVSAFESLKGFIDRPKGFDLFSDFMVRESLAASPEVRQLDAAVIAQRRALLTTRRDRYIPDVGLFADMTGRDNSGAGTGLEFPGLNAWDWTIGFEATLPVFEGGALGARTFKAKEEVDELLLQRDALRQRIDQRTRSTLQDTGASFTTIELSRRAAEAAHQNLDLVADTYRQGVVGILTLLDAQDQALVADLVAANSIFEYLLNLLSTQRAVGRFDYYRSSQDRQDFLNRLRTFYSQSNYIVRNP